QHFESDEKRTLRLGAFDSHPSSIRNSIEESRDPEASGTLGTLRSPASHFGISLIPTASLTVQSAPRHSRTAFRSVSAARSLGSPRGSPKPPPPHPRVVPALSLSLVPRHNCPVLRRREGSY